MIVVALSNISLFIDITFEFLTNLAYLCLDLVLF